MENTSLNKKNKITGYKILFLAIILAGVFFLFKHSSILFIALGVICLALGIVGFYLSNDKNYTHFVDNIRVVNWENAKDLTEIYEDFKDLDTPLGKPWMGKIMLAADKAIIFGPNKCREYVYIYKNKENNKLIIADNDVVDFIIAGEDDAYRLDCETHINEDYKVSISRMMDAGFLVEDLVKILLDYKDKNISPTSYKGFNRRNHLYILKEDKLENNNRCSVRNLDDKKILEIECDSPFSTLKTLDLNNNEIFKISKQEYDKTNTFYKFTYKNKFYGILIKEDKSLNTYSFNTKDGDIKMHGVNSLMADNYRINVNGENVATIAEELHLKQNDNPFDNFIISIENKKYLHLVAAFAVLTIKEECR